MYIWNKSLSLWFLLKCVNFNVKIKWFYFTINFTNCLQLWTLTPDIWITPTMSVWSSRHLLTNIMYWNFNNMLSLPRTTYKYLLYTSRLQRPNWLCITFTFMVGGLRSTDQGLLVPSLLTAVQPTMYFKISYKIAIWLQ